MATEIVILALLYTVAVGLLVADLFLPSHFVLTVAGIGFLVWAIVRTFLVTGQTTGVIAVLACMVFLPVFFYASIRLWPHTPIGRRIAPPNPIVTTADTSVPVAELAALIGREGRAVSMLRPVGICDFGGRRVSCTAESGMIDAGANVVALGIHNANLTVAQRRDL